MNIIKLGVPQNKEQDEFYFRCIICGCEWTANNGDKGMWRIPSNCSSYARMQCPNCGTWCIDKQTLDMALQNSICNYEEDKDENT